MEFDDESHPTTWSDDELIVQELLDDDSPFYLLPEEQHYSNSEFNPTHENMSIVAQLLLSNLHSGPDEHKTWGINRIDGSKYTLKLKCFGNGMADDGYKWRKYGQKSIKNSPYPRSYYKCTNRRCSAKKQVERSRDEEDTLIITYEGLHLHFTYPYYFPVLYSDGSASGEDHPPPPKKPKITSPEAEEANGLFVTKDAASQGLLEDVVPFVIRNPAAVVDSVNSSSSYNLLLGSNSCCSSSYRSSPVASSSSSLSWSSLDSE